jgi:hypothetical protein
MAASLFIEELDGITGATPEDAAWDADAAWYGQHPEDDPYGPVWSNYGGWVN